MIDISELKADEAGEWKKFLESSSNGTIFHDLDFLSYHRAGRFNLHHLIFRRAGKILALLPAAIIAEESGARSALKSPYGASVGGLVLPPGLGAADAVLLASSLRQYALDHGLDAIEMRLSPAIYLKEPEDAISFALMASGFQLRRTWICHAIKLPVEGEILSVFSRGKARDVRAGLRRGLVSREASGNDIAQFYNLLVATKAKHNSTPTHTRGEVEWLVQNLPGRIWLFLCERERRVLSGILAFVINSNAAYTFYICQEESDGDPFSTAVLLAYAAEKFSKEKIGYLDLGPSSFDDLRLNESLSFYKEGFGAKGFCRNEWRWNRG